MTQRKSWKCLKEQAGCWLHERWKLELLLRLPKLANRFGLDWRTTKNRHERLIRDDRVNAYRCDWQHSSELTVARIFPDVARRFAFHLFSQYQIGYLGFDTPRPLTTKRPSVSVIVPFGGTERLPQLLVCLKVLRALQGEPFEIIVVEQSAQLTVVPELPVDIQWIHQAFVPHQRQFNKSRAMNLGAAHARGNWLLLIDGDLLLPNNALQLFSKIPSSIYAIWPARMIFHASQDATREMYSANIINFLSSQPTKVIQNNPTPVAISREVYWSIGGHDEGFEGWGGEDVEFRDRLRTVEVSEAGIIPIGHLWHPDAPKKVNGDRNSAVQERKLREPVAARITRLWKENAHYLQVNQRVKYTHSIDISE